jgi:hypothetical protein
MFESEPSGDGETPNPISEEEPWPLNVQPDQDNEDMVASIDVAME